MLQEDSNEGYGLKGLWVVTKKYLEREACKLGPDTQMHGSPPVGLEEVDTDAQAREGKERGSTVGSEGEPEDLNRADSGRAWYLVYPIGQ